MPGRSDYPHVFRPIHIGPVEIPGRVYMTPAGVSTLHERDPALPGFCKPGKRLQAYYVERARSGLGLLMQGFTLVHPTSHMAGGMQLFTDHSVDLFAPVVRAVHEHGTKMFVQLMHAGNHGDLRRSFGGPLSSSDIPGVELKAKGLPQPMSHDQITEVVAGFARCAANAKAAGYDGIELHGAHSYLIQQFLSPFFNKRDDQYGGTLDNRLRFLLEILAAIRGEIGDEMALGVRLNADEGLPGGLGSDDVGDIAAGLDGWGVDFLDFDLGTYHSFSKMMPPVPVPRLHAAGAISQLRHRVSRAVFMGCPTRLGRPEEAETLLVSGAVDMVGAARSFFADAGWLRKAADGAESEIRPCIGMNTCFAGGSCTVNPVHARELDWGEGTLEKASAPRRVVVVGGGPAGLETARTAALRGHHVVIFERRDQLGGALHVMGGIPGHGQVLDAAIWWAHRLDDAGVKIHCGVDATTENVLAENPDAVVIATGARFDRSGVTGFVSAPVPGWGNGIVRSPEDVLENGWSGEGRAVVLDEDAHVTGVGVAHALAERGMAVDLVTRWPAAAFRAEGTFQTQALLTNARRAGVQIHVSTYVRAIEDRSVTLYDVFTDQDRKVEDVGCVVLVTSRRPVGHFAAELRDRVSEVHVIGDAERPRTMVEAVEEGHRIGRAL